MNFNFTEYASNYYSIAVSICVSKVDILKILWYIIWYNVKAMNPLLPHHNLNLFRILYVQQTASILLSQKLFSSGNHQDLPRNFIYFEWMNVWWSNFSRKCENKFYWHNAMNLCICLSVSICTSNVQSKFNVWKININEMLVNI